MGPAVAGGRDGLVQPKPGRNLNLEGWRTDDFPAVPASHFVGFGSTGGKTLSEYMLSEYPLIADIVGAPIANLKISLRRSDPRCCSSSEIALVPGIVPIGSRSAAHCAYGDCIRPKLRCRGWRRGVLPRAMWRSASSAPR